MTRIKTFFVVALLLFSTLPSVGLAQSTSSAQPMDFLEDSPLQCSDYYWFGSVTGETTFLAETAVAGLPAQFEAVITNTNPNPIVDATILAKIFSTNDTGEIEMVLDEMTVATNQVLVTGKNNTVNFDWLVPNELPSGEYYASLYVVSNGQYNWLGLPFSDSVPGATVAFTVVGESESLPITFNPNDVTVNGTKYPTAETPMLVPVRETAVITAVVENALDEEVVIPLEWHQYAWSAEMPESLKNTVTELVILGPKEKKTVSYSTVPQSEAVIFVTAKIQSGDFTNQIRVRLVQEDLNQLRTGYLGISQFPLKAGESVTAIACAQNINRTLIDMAQVTLTLKDKNDEVIRTIEYFGPATGALRGYGEEFTLEKSYNYLKIESSLVRNGVIDEMATVVYDCTVIDPTTCLDDETVVADSGDKQPINLFLVVGGFIILTLLGIIFVYFLRPRGVPPNPPQSPTPSSPISLNVILFALLLSGLPSFASAQSCPALEFGYTSPTDASDVILYQGATAPNCLALCNAAMASQTGTRYCNYSSAVSGMQWGFVVPDVSLSNGSTVYTCRLSQQPTAYSNPFSGLSLLTGATWSASTCTPPAPTNNPPATPTITGPATGQANTSYSFSVRATDPDNNTLRYGIDVNNDSLVDAWLPSSGYTNSGTQLSYSRLWASAGTYNIRAVAEDSNGARSGWASHSIVVSATPLPSGTLDATGCTIPAGASTCNGTASWNISNTVDRAIFNLTHGILYSTSATGVNVPISLRIGDNEIAAFPRAGGVPEFTSRIDGKTVRASCATGTEWNGSICATTATSCGPVGSQYRWNGVNWDDYSTTPIGWSMTNIGMTASTPPGPFSGQQNMGYGVTWISQNVMSCGASGPSCSSPAVTYNAANFSNNFNTARNQCISAGYTDIIALSTEELASIVGMNKPNGTCFAYQNDSFGGIANYYYARIPGCTSAGSCALGAEQVGDSGPTDMFAGSPPCVNVDDLAPYVSPSCPVGATTGTVVSASNILTAGFCATRQTQSSACFGTAYIRSCNGLPPPPVPNQPPAAPTITGPSTGAPSTAYTFSFTATDANNDQIRYGVDWDFNGIVDAWLPASGYINSGSAQTANRTWSTNGAFSFRALTQDAAGATSGWTTHTIIIDTDPNACSWDYEPDPSYYPYGGNCSATMPACSSLSPAVSDAGDPVTSGSPERCYLSCPAFQPTVGTTNNVLRQLCLPSTTASCSTPGILFTPGSSAEYTAARASCFSLGYTRLVEAGQEDAQPGFFNNVPSGTCSVIFADTNGAIMYRYAVYSLAACVPPGPIVANSALSGTTCEIPAGSSSCTGTASWDLPTASNPIIRNDTHNILYGAGSNGAGNPINLRYGLNRVVAYDDTMLIDYVDLVTRCEDGSFWNNSFCEAVTAGGSSCFINQVVDPTGTSCGINGDPVTIGTVNACTEGCGGGCGSYDNLDTLVCFLPMTPIVLANLTSVLIPSNIVPSTSGNNTIAGIYNSVAVTGIIRNIGSGSTGVAVPYSLLLTNQTTNAQTPHSNQVGVIAGNGTAPASYAFTNVPFGVYTIRMDADPAPGVVAETDETDNWAERVDYILPPPDPGIDLTVSPGTVVRSGTVVTLNWTVNVSYDMNCSLVGPSLTNPVSFNPRTSATTGSVTAGPITATSDYTLSCTEPITNTTFTDTTRVETVGTVEEI